MSELSLQLTRGILILHLAVLSYTAAAQTLPHPDSTSREAQPLGNICSASASSDDSQSTRSGGSSRSSPICSLAHLGQCLKDLGRDQAGIWTSPLRIKSSDALWLTPFASATAAAIYYDPDALRELGVDKGRTDTSRKISQFGSPYATLGEAGALYLFGSVTHNNKLAETGRLGAEAVIDASIVAEGLKLATNRQRPEDGNGQGNFWPHGTRDYSFDSAFPSGHAAASWALARVIASEYPNKLTQLGAYAFATAISISRVTGGKHFPSDALVGSVFGYLVGGYVVRHHASEYQEMSSYSLAPVMDPFNRTYGLSIELHPQRRELEQIERLLKRLHQGNQSPAGLPPGGLHD
jgi:membrane-associated phospholipid phosphatase